MTGLLAKLKTLAFASGGVQNPHLTLAKQLRRSTNVHQGRTESLASYHKRFLANTEVLEAHWGPFCPMKLAGNEKDADKKSRNKLQAMIFLEGADDGRFGKLKHELNNSYLADNDNYPESLDATLTRLSLYQDNQDGGLRNAGAPRTKMETSFAQTRYQQRLASIRCYECNELGHVARDCPRQQTHTQQNEETGSEASNDDSARPRTGWSG